MLQGAQACSRLDCLRGKVRREVVSLDLLKNVVDSVPLLASRLPVQEQAGLWNCCPNSRSDWHSWSCCADWLLAVAAEDHAVQGLAIATPWIMCCPVAPAKSSVSHASDTQLQEALPQSSHPRRASPPRLQEVLVLYYHSRLGLHSRRSCCTQVLDPSRCTRAPLRADVACAQPYPQ